MVIPYCVNRQPISMLLIHHHELNVLLLENGIKIHDLTLLTEEFLFCAEELVPLTQPALIIKEYRRTAIGLRSLIRRHKKYESAYWNLKKAMLFVNNFKLRHTIQRQYHAIKPTDKEGVNNVLLFGL